MRPVSDCKNDVQSRIDDELAERVETLRDSEISARRAIVDEHVEAARSLVSTACESPSAILFGDGSLLSVGDDRLVEKLAATEIESCFFLSADQPVEIENYNLGSDSQLRARVLIGEHVVASVNRDNSYKLRDNAVTKKEYREFCEAIGTCNGRELKGRNAFRQLPSELKVQVYERREDVLDQAGSSLEGLFRNHIHNSSFVGTLVRTECDDGSFGSKLEKQVEGEKLPSNPIDAECAEVTSHEIYANTLYSEGWGDPHHQDFGSHLHLGEKLIASYESGPHVKNFTDCRILLNINDTELTEVNPDSYFDYERMARNLGRILRFKVIE